MERFIVFQSVITDKGFFCKNLKNLGATEKLICHLNISDEPLNYFNTAQ